MNLKIFDMLVDNAVNERLDRFVINSREYKQVQSDIRHITEETEKYNFTQDEKKLIDRLICSYTAEGACVSRLAYAQGFKDCITLLKEIELLR